MTERSLFRTALTSFIFILLLIPEMVKPDTVILNNGTLLVGKIKSESKAAVVFKNSYGAFTISRKEITSLYVTKSYKEDIAVRKKLGMDFDEKEIRNNYEAGQKDLTDKEKNLIVKEDEKTAETGIELRIFFEGAAIASQGELKDIIPYGYVGFAGFEFGERYIGSSGVKFLIPWFRGEAGYLTFSKDDALLSGFTGGAGPLWHIPVSVDRRSSIRLSLEPGISSVNIENGEKTDSSLTFTFHSILGYEYSFDYISVFINIRYMYVYDKDVFYNSMGVSAGVSGRVW